MSPLSPPSPPGQSLACARLLVTSRIVYQAADPTHPNADGKVNCYWLDRSRLEADGTVCSDFIQVRAGAQTADGPCQDHATVSTRCQAVEVGDWLDCSFSPFACFNAEACSVCKASN